MGPGNVRTEESSLLKESKSSLLRSVTGGVLLIVGFVGLFLISFGKTPRSQLLVKEVCLACLLIGISQIPLPGPTGRLLVIMVLLVGGMLLSSQGQLISMGS